MEYVFRNYYYVITYISWKPVGEKKESYANTEYIIIIANRTFILTTSEVKIITFKISIRELKFKIYYFDKYVIFIFYIKGVLFNRARTFI